MPADVPIFAQLKSYYCVAPALSMRRIFVGRQGMDIPDLAFADAFGNVLAEQL